MSDQALLREVLSSIRALVGRIASRWEEARAPDRERILSEHRGELYRAMDRLGGWIAAFLASAPGPDERSRALETIRDCVHELSAESPFFYRSFHKPRGYPGDFETLEILYRNRSNGADPPGVVMDDYYRWSKAAQAARNRVRYLSGRLAELVREQQALGHEVVRLLSLGSGSAGEVEAFCREHGSCDAIEVTLVDLDPDALEVARGRLEGFLGTRLRLVRGNVFAFARGARLESEPYHLIWAAGLFDYLSDERAAGLVTACFQLLAPAGTILIGNYSPCIPYNERLLIEWLLDWYLIYRDASDYEAIFAATPFGSEDLAIECEPLEINLFAVARRPVERVAAPAN